MHFGLFRRCPGDPQYEYIFERARVRAGSLGFSESVSGFDRPRTVIAFKTKSREGVGLKSMAYRFAK